MTRVLAAADLHIGATHLTTLDEQRQALDEIVDIVEREKVQLVVIAGDAMHHGAPAPGALALLGAFYRALAEYDVRIIQISGNHDPLVPSVAQHFRAFVDVATEPRLIQIDQHRIGLGRVDVACLPYLPDRFVRARMRGDATKDEIATALTVAARDILRGFLAQRREGVPMVLVAHGTVAGTQTSSGWSMGFVGGTDWRLDDTDLAEFDLAIVGHIHRHQAAAPNVVIPGSLLPLDFSETDPHGVVLANVGQSLGAFHSGGSWEFVPLLRVPDVTTWTIDRGEIGNLLNNREDWPVSRGEKIRIHYMVDEATAREYPPARISKVLYDAGASLVQVELEIDRPDRARDDAMTIELAPARALVRYLDSREDLDEPTRLAIADRGVESIETQLPAAAAAAGDLELRALEARDFLGVHEARVEFDGHGVYAITGPVGAGKSTVGCDVARFALFGSSRAGAKVSDRLIRQGADLATAAVELDGAEGKRYRVVRKLKRTPRGVTSTLDVLTLGARDDGQTYEEFWRPLSTGKVADGDAAIARILGGLTDETLVASSLVIQRAADAFTRARPEDRKRLLAEAAGLHVYDDLATTSRERLTAAERALELLHAQARPLRDRVERIPVLEREVADLDAAVKELEARVAERTAERDEVEAALRKATERAGEYDRILDQACARQMRIDAIDGELADWKRKEDAARAILAERAELLAAREELGRVSAQIVELEAQLVAETAAVGERNAAQSRRSYMEERLSGERQKREQESRGLDHLIDEAKKKGALIDEAACCAPEPSCVFLVDARKAVAGIPELETKLDARAEPSGAEAELIKELADFVVPDAPDPSITKGKITKARARARELESQRAIAEKIAKAEEVLAQLADVTERLEKERAKLATDKATFNAQLVGFGGNPKGEITRATQARTAAAAALQETERDARQFAESAADRRGRLATLLEAREELAEIDGQITAGAVDVAAWKELVDAWKACRVMVLETSVIPAVETTANEILRCFPYGMQLAFLTQREKRSGDGLSEALDVEVLGGRGPIYELCSGGQKTTIDFALHVAIALVVSRRSATRLRFLFADEPEGLDEPGRAAFAAIARWIHEEFGLTVLVASHAADLVDALGGQRIDVVPGPDGSTVQVAS